MHALGPAGSALFALIAAAALLLPPGYAALRAAGVRASGMAGLTLAFASGFTLVLPLVWIEGRLGGPYLVVPCAVLCALWLRPGRAALEAVRSLRFELLLPLLFAVLAFLANRLDVQATSEGISFRPGFDVADRVFYAAVAEELGRAGPGGVENPVFAGLPLQYAFLPCLAGLLLGRYTGAPLTLAFLVQWPVVGLFLVGVAVLGFLEDAGVRGRLTRWSTALLVVLGGDLSFLTQESPAPFARFGRFFVFFSFSAESLFYNPWTFGLPLTLALLIAARGFLRDGHRGRLALAALLIAGLWQTKAFAVAALLAGGLAAAVATRRARVLVLTAAGALAVLPLLLWAAATGAAREGLPLRVAPLLLVKTAVANSPTLAALHERLGLVAIVPIFLVGGFGVRLLGLRALVAEARSDASGFGVWLLASLAATTVAALLVAGNPTAIEGVQFLLLAQLLLWLHAGPALSQLASRWPVLGAALLGLALASPAGYLGRKIAPGLYRSQGSRDAESIAIPSAALDACRYLSARSAPADRLLVPLDGPSGAVAARGLYLAALCGRRVPAAVAPFHVSADVASRRIDAVRRVYAAEDAASADAALDALAVAWVWEDDHSPLRFASPRLALAFASGSTRLYRVQAAGGE
ncbi:MAG TPA: hypothetical protein VFM88_04980 [Vicinamibacteria bacterium]|nr:hypothetical protein [Vicinamibacteria bacterium]